MYKTFNLHARNSPRAISLVGEPAVVILGQGSYIF